MSFNSIPKSVKNLIKNNYTQHTGFSKKSIAKAFIKSTKRNRFQ